MSTRARNMTLRLGGAATTRRSRHGQQRHGGSAGAPFLFLVLISLLVLVRSPSSSQQPRPRREITRVLQGGGAGAGAGAGALPVRGSSTQHASNHRRNTLRHQSPPLLGPASSSSSADADTESATAATRRPHHRDRDALPTPPPSPPPTRPRRSDSAASVVGATTMIRLLPEPLQPLPDAVLRQYDAAGLPWTPATMQLPDEAKGGGVEKHSGAAKLARCTWETPRTEKRCGADGGLVLEQEDATTGKALVYDAYVMLANDALGGNGIGFATGYGMTLGALRHGGSFQILEDLDFVVEDEDAALAAVRQYVETYFDDLFTVVARGQGLEQHVAMDLEGFKRAKEAAEEAQHGRPLRDEPAAQLLAQLEEPGKLHSAAALAQWAALLRQVGWDVHRTDRFWSRNRYKHSHVPLFRVFRKAQLRTTPPSDAEASPASGRALLCVGHYVDFWGIEQPAHGIPWQKIVTPTSTRASGYGPRCGCAFGGRDTVCTEGACAWMRRMYGSDFWAPRAWGEEQDMEFDCPGWRDRYRARIAALRRRRRQTSSSSSISIRAREGEEKVE